MKPTAIVSLAIAASLTWLIFSSSGQQNAADFGPETAPGIGSHAAGRYQLIACSLSMGDGTTRTGFVRLDTCTGEAWFASGRQYPFPALTGHTNEGQTFPIIGWERVSENPASDYVAVLHRLAVLAGETGTTNGTTR